MTEPLLLSVDDVGASRALRFEQGPVAVGREPAAQVCLQDAEVSRVHGRFEASAAGWAYVDNGSDNGSRLNGRLLSPGTPVGVKPGDRLTLGGALIALLAPPGRGDRPGPDRATGQVRRALRLHIEAAGGAYAVVLTHDATIGREPGCTVHIQDDRISRRHATLQRVQSGWTFTDDDSLNGSALDGRRLPPRMPVPLSDGAALSLGGLPVRVELIAEAAGAQQQPHATSPVPARSSQRPPHRPVTIGAGAVRVGRALDNDLVISDPHVSSYHLVARPTESGVHVWDLDSLNGTTVDGARIQQVQAGLDAQIVLGGSATITGRQLLARLAQTHAPAPAPAAHNAEPLAVGRGLTRIVDGGKVILREFDFCVRRGQFVAIVGASGTGKSTLVKVLNRYTPPQKGVLVAALNGHGEEEIGYVPQDDIVHRELKLRDAVELSAAIRFPPGTPAQRIRHRADEVLSDLGLKELAGTPVGRLSGGQRKRAAVAVELMTSPALLILDEATSGLDPATERRLMELLRKLAGTGNVGVVLVTHATANIDLCDTVAFLAPGGYEVFWGTPHEARTYFGIGERFDDIYLKIEEEGSPAGWRERFVKSRAYADLQTSCDAAQADLQATAARQPRQAPPAGRSRRQLRGLVNRYAHTQLAGWRTPLLMLLQVPLLLLLTHLIPRIGDGDVLSLISVDGSGPKTLTSAMQLLFVLALIMIWSGAFNSAREICKEGAIWERERHAGIGSLPYVLSKVIVLGALCLAQVLCLLLVVSVFWSMPEEGPGLFALAAAAFVAVMSGVAMGLALSSLASTPDQAMALLPLILIPQLLLAGSNPTLGAMGRGGNIITSIIAARWAYGAFGNAMARGIALARFYRCPNGIDQCGPYSQMNLPWEVSLLALLLLSTLLISATVFFAGHSRSRATG